MTTQIAIGTRLGPYEILSRIGAGGMGEVWRARDTRLDRAVAIKVLPAALAANEQFRARFEREAKTISQFNHPNICTLHDVGYENGVSYLVMELLEGDSLHDRLARGPMPLSDVLRYGAQIAAALDRAHRAGIVHRDLKPANVVITKSGAKLLDFGLAKSAPSTAVNLEGATEHKPLTQEGTILGTFQYMAPEQLEGTEADARTDIFALGALLYEMVTGRRAFEGKTKTSLIAAIVDRDPTPISQVQPLTPPAFEHVVAKCLEKDPDARWQSAHDVAQELSWIAVSGSAAGLSAPLTFKRRMRERLAWTLAIAFIGVTAALLLRPRAASRPHIRFSVPIPEGTKLEETVSPYAAISPDGTTIAFFAQSAAGVTALYIRSLQEFETRRVTGTEQGHTPFFSPDGKWIGFCAGAKLRKVLVTGGNATDIAPADSITGADWSEDDRIVFAPSYNTGIYIVAASGGTPRQLSAPDRKHHESSHGWPQFLPGSKWVIFTIENSGSSFNDATIVAQSLATGERRVLVRGGTRAQYVPTGHLVFARSSTLFAVPFDAKRVAVTGSPVEVMKDVAMTQGRGVSQWAFSRTGTLLFTPGQESGDDDILGSCDRSGSFVPLTRQLNGYTNLALSPDGKKVAFARRWSDDDIWIHDLERDLQTRVGFMSEHVNPTWSADGRRLIFASDRNGAFNLYSMSSDGAGLIERLTTSPNQQAPNAVSPAGLLIYSEADPETRSDIWTLSLSGNHQTQPLIRTPFDENAAAFSPDGKFLAWVSNESGRNEVYARSITDGEKWQVSTAGGDGPRWARNGNEIFYRNGTQMLAAGVSGGSALHISRPQVLFDNPALRNVYDVTPDGRFIVVREASAPGAREFRVVLNWFDELEERLR